MKHTVKPSPCGSCPYRVNAPSGVWAEEEYMKLTDYDGDIARQVRRGALRLFCCHSTPDQLCSGWVGHREHPTDLLALRLGIFHGEVDESAADYETDVALWSSGHAAAAHGMRDIDGPGAAALAAVAKVQRLRDDLIPRGPRC